MARTMKLAGCALLALAMFGSANAQEAAEPQEADGVEAAAYPASYPYENDVYINVMPPGKDNVLTGSKTEPGGYMAAAVAHCNPYAYTPYGWVTGGASDCGRHVMYFFTNSFGVAYATQKPFNCSQVYQFAPSIINKGSFDGSAEVCEWGSCCKGYWDSFQLTKDFIALQDRWNSRYKKYGCSWINEEIYCGLILFETHWCREQYVSGALGEGGAMKRFMVMPCMNAYSWYLEKCKTFKLVGTKSILKATAVEPPAFIDSMTAAEANSALSVFYQPDRVCVPLSDIDPTMKASAEQPAAPAEGGAPAPTAAAGGSTPAASTPAASTPAAASDSAATGLTVSFSVIGTLFAAMRAL